MDHSKVNTDSPEKPIRRTGALKPALKEFDGSWTIIGLFVACLIWAARMAAVGWHNRLSDMHGFRQTQTAITSYYLARGGPFFRYETPIFGYPWSIPFEFPIYQWITAITSRLIHLNLDQAGRLINEAFFALTLAAMWGVLAELRVRRVHRLIFLTLTLVSPLYVFWSRTFMIESTALFFCTAYLYFIVRYLRTGKIVDAALGGLWGVLACLVKVTTFPAFAIVGVIIYLVIKRHEYRRFRESKSFKVYLPHLLAILFFGCLPILAALIWVNYTDDVKALNLVSRFSLNSSVLRTWTFGTLNQRLASSSWETLLFRTIPDLFGHSLVVAVPIVALLFSRKRWIAFLISILGFLAAFLLFTNLHVVHDYYSYGNGVFLIAAVSWCIVGLLEGNRRQKFLGLAIFVICIVSSVWGYYERFYEVQKNAPGYVYNFSKYNVFKNNANYLNDVAGAIKTITRPDEILLILQRDWPPEIPYYSERRALMWPQWMDQRIDSAEMKEALQRLGNNKIGAVVLCNGAQTDSEFIQRARSVLNTTARPYFENAMCVVYPAGKIIESGGVDEASLAEPPRPAPAHYSGAVDMVNCNQIGGWVWNSLDPRADVKVDIYIDGTLIGTVPARISRPDLRNIGTGKYGFALPVPPQVKDNQPHLVAAKVSGTSYNLKVEQTPPGFTCSPQ